MEKSRFAEAQIIGMIKEQEQGQRIALTATGAKTPCLINQ